MSLKVLREDIVHVHEIRLTPVDIPGAELQGPFQNHTVSALRWWMQCRSKTVQSSLKKQQIIKWYSYISLQNIFMCI